MSDNAIAPDPDITFEDDPEETTSVILIKRSGPVKKSKTIPGGQSEGGKDRSVWEGANVLAPPLPPEGLLRLYGVSDSLRQNVDAMARNVDAFGWTPEPVIDLYSDDTVEEVRTALYLSRVRGESAPDLPDDAEVENAIKEWRQLARIEKSRMKLFFDQVCVETSFVELRQRTTIDREVIGWGAWEVIRDDRGRVVRFKHVPAHTLRLRKLGAPVEVEEQRRSSAVTFETIKVSRRFRVIAQLDNDRGGDKVIDREGREWKGAAAGAVRYFREFGDPRFVSSRTGEVYESEEQARQDDNEGDDVTQANEILLFPIYFPGTPYGQPRWHGQIPTVKGGRLAADNVVDYLENSAIPRGLLLVSDGKLGKSSVQDIKSYFGSVKGQAENRLAVIQAETPRDRAFEGGGRVQIQWVSLRDAQRDDATFSGYRDECKRSIGEAFRLPPILRGDTRNFNRATAQAAMDFAEEQVFAPERRSFDYIVNTRILPLLGIRFWAFRSRGPNKLDPTSLAKTVEILGKLGVLVPAELRPVAEQLLGFDLLRGPGAWQNLPLSLVQQGFVPPGAEQPGTTPGEQPGDDRLNLPEPVSTEPAAEEPAPAEVEEPEQLEARKLADAARLVLKHASKLRGGDLDAVIEEIERTRFVDAEAEAAALYDDNGEE